MNTPAASVCPRCDGRLLPDAPKGLCPRCLAAMNLATETQFTDLGGGAAREPLTPAELAPHFPQLEILECLGRGGMGVVYKARQKTLNRVVALKLLAPERVTDAGFAERFTREAQALARLNHPNIVTIHDFGVTTPPQTPDARPHPPFFYLLMEFVDGVNLRQAMKAGRFTPEQALAIVPPVCEALQYAHEQGIVHRDIKPENLLLDKTGRVKIADFGIAKLVARHSDVEPPPSDSTLESRATTGGTPGYMAPEQKSAPQRVDSRADIYSLGVVLYELLTGELPGAKLQPPSRKVQIDVRLDDVVLRALETRPELRYATAAEFRTQVENITGTATPAPLQPASGQSGSWLAPAISLVLFFAGLVIGIPFINALPVHKDSGYLALAAFMFCLASVVGFLAANSVQQLRSSPAASANASARAWLKGLGWLAFVLAVPVIGFGIFFLLQVLTEPVTTASGGGWNPTPSEALFVPLTWFGSLLLPMAGLTLLRMAASVPKPATVQAKSPWRTAFVVLLAAAAAFALVLLVGFLVVTLSYNAQKVSRAEQTARAARAAEQRARDQLAPPVRPPVPQTTAAPSDASPITSSIVAKDNSPAAIAAAQQRGIASATRDIQAGIFRILAYGDLMPTSPSDTDEETGFRIQWVAGSILSSQFQAEADAYNFAMRDRYWKHEHWKRPPPGPASTATRDDFKPAAVTRNFPLRHKLGSDMVDQLRSILLGQPGHEAKASANNQEVIVTVPPDVMKRVQTCIAVTDWPDGMKDFTGIGYLQHTVDRAARSFFYACAIENSGKSMENLLSLRVLAELKGGERTAQYEHYQMGGTPDPAWEKSLRGDWPGKAAALQRLVREWNRYPMKSIREEAGVAMGFGVKHFCSVAFEGAPKEFYQVTIEPDRTKPRGSGESAFFFGSLPPWWQDAPRAATVAPAVQVATGAGKYDLASGVTLVITAKPPPRGTGGKHFDGRLDWPKSATSPKAESFDVALSEGAPFAVGWRADGKVLWVACGAGTGTTNDARYLRKLTITGPGDVEEQSWDAREKSDFGGLPAELRRVFDAFIAPAPK